MADEPLDQYSRPSPRDEALADMQYGHPGDVDPREQQRQEVLLREGVDLSAPWYVRTAQRLRRDWPYIVFGALNALGPRAGAHRVGPGIDNARATAAARNENLSASGWPADNVVVPHQPGTYQMGPGGSWRIPFDSHVTGEQLASFGQMPPPRYDTIMPGVTVPPRVDYMGPIPRYQPPPREGPAHRPAAGSDLDELQKLYLRLAKPEGGVHADGGAVDPLDQYGANRRPSLTDFDVFMVRNQPELLQMPGDLPRGDPAGPPGVSWGAAMPQSPEETEWHRRLPLAEMSWLLSPASGYSGGYRLAEGVANRDPWQAALGLGQIGTSMLWPAPGVGPGMVSRAPQPARPAPASEAGAALSPYGQWLRERGIPPPPPPDRLIGPGGVIINNPVRVGPPRATEAQRAFHARGPTSRPDSGLDDLTEVGTLDALTRLPSPRGEYAVDAYWRGVRGLDDLQPTIRATPNAARQRALDQYGALPHGPAFPRMEGVSPVEARNAFMALRQSNGDFEAAIASLGSVRPDSGTVALLRSWQAAGVDGAAALRYFQGLRELRNLERPPHGGHADGGPVAEPEHEGWFQQFLRKARELKRRQSFEDYGVEPAQAAAKWYNDPPAYAAVTEPPIAFALGAMDSHPIPRLGWIGPMHHKAEQGEPEYQKATHEMMWTRMNNPIPYYAGMGLGLAGTVPMFGRLTVPWTAAVLATDPGVQRAVRGIFSRADGGEVLEQYFSPTLKQHVR